MRYPRLQYYDEPGRLSACDALVMCFYMKYPNDRIAPAVIRALELFREWIRPYQLAWNDTGEGQAEPLDNVSGERTRRNEALKLIRPRYPGVHLAWSGANLHMNTWVDGVHWMNFLGQPVLGKLGGVTGLREHLSLPGISLQEMRDDRFLITLGERPEVGDVEAGQTLPMHRALARLLEPHLYHWKPTFGGPASEELLRWERRFLD